MERSVVRPARRTRLIAAGAVVAALLTAGCGETVGHTDATGDRADGKELFVAKCGSCHTLADAGTKGQIGPNLDYAFLQSRRDGLGESTIMQVVRGQIAYPVTETSTGAPGMPKNIVKARPQSTSRRMSLPSPAPAFRVPGPVRRLRGADTG